jgi:hypothetical protein
VLNAGFGSVFDLAIAMFRQIIPIIHFGGLVLGV